MAIILDRQAELEGLLMGPSTAYHWETFSPWSYPDVAVQDIGQPQRHGVFSGGDLMRARRITGRLNVVAAGKQAAIDAMHALVAAWQPLDHDVPFDWRAGSRTYRVYGRPRLADPNAAKSPAGVVAVDVRFLATDPLIYDAVLQEGETEFPEPTDDYEDPYSEPYTDPLTNGRIPVNNEGTMPAPWTATVHGPWTNPRFMLLDPVEAFPIPAGIFRVNIDLLDGDTLELDLGREIAWVNGVPRLDLLVDRALFRIPPGEWDIRVDGTAGTGTTEVTTRSTWL